MSKIEVEHFVTRKSVEDAYRECRRAQENRRDLMAAHAMRAARAKDPKMLKALEGGATILQKMSEEQMGQSGMDVGGLRVQSTEFQLWRNAYTTMDSGTPQGQYQWIYVAAGFLAGLW